MFPVILLALQSTKSLRCLPNVIDTHLFLESVYPSQCDTVILDKKWYITTMDALNFAKQLCKYTGSDGIEWATNIVVDLRVSIMEYCDTTTPCIEICVRETHIMCDLFEELDHSCKKAVTKALYGRPWNMRDVCKKYDVKTVLQLCRTIHCKQPEHKFIAPSEVLDNAVRQQCSDRAYDLREITGRKSLMLRRAKFDAKFDAKLDMHTRFGTSNGSFVLDDVNRTYDSNVRVGKTENPPWIKVQRHSSFVPLDVTAGHIAFIAVLLLLGCGINIRWQLQASSFTRRSPPFKLYVGKKKQVRREIC